MTLSIKDGRYAFLIKLNLMFSMSLWKEFQLLQILNELSIKHLIKLILYENNVKLLKRCKNLTPHLCFFLSLFLRFSFNYCFHYL